MILLHVFLYCVTRTKPESPAFKGDSPLVLSSTAGAGDLFQPPPARVQTAV